MNEDGVTIEISENEIDQIIKDFSKELYQTRQEALNAGAEFFKNKLETSSPRESGEYAQSWDINDQYADKKYVFNKKTVKQKNKNIPLSNILEYSLDSKHYGSIRALFDSNKNGIYNAIFEKIKNKNGGN